jgi:cell division protease FtsH
MHNKEAVTMEELEEARDKIRFGREKRSRVMSEQDREITAYHESGHAVLSKLLKGVDPLHKVGIVPRGMALGATMSIPEKDQYSVSKTSILAQITQLMGGLVAEELFCHDLTSGNQSDLKHATMLARYMVTKWGMSEKLGPIDFSDDNEPTTLAKELSGAKPYSEATAVTIDAEIRRIIGECMERAQTLVNEHKAQTEAIAKALLQYETLDAEDVELIMQGKDLGPRKQMVYNPVDGDHKPHGDGTPTI